ncbi:efflux RND transporter periplasmic adaptor subunit [Cohnella lubricantis]|uniref:Efflux RND transporter periplasmic adaptor subunit n=1 Tax=Cohnella lubricantis TaxID=2163172 RepID=A0A841TEJ4_9BACL|nr:efflux RND transporter periplasmic adaptor subunit [Cohnella lubricantis]MBB6677650.1 efflux RND transporter periplasmic adaptor subunit [Cohnella lubricantis]MBP2116462.1 HlyD family secretion protein [Cohnella lubricantis]
MKKRRLKKLITWAVVVCVVAAGGGTGYWWYNKDTIAAAAPAYMEARVTQGTITQSVSGSGTVAVSETEDAIVSEAGTIASVKVKEGDEVKQGQVLATFEGADVSLSLNKAKLTLEQQQMQLEQAQDKWKSLQVSGAEQSELDSAEMSIKSAQLNIEQTRLEIQDYEEKAQAPDPIVAPIDGTVTAMDVKAGDEVQARLAAFTIVNYNKLEVSISADELDITKISVGQSANVSIEALSGQRITGKVAEISKDGSASNGVSTFPVVVTLDQTENVLPGMSADVEILIQQKEDALIVPVDAVESVGGKYFVRVPKGEGASAESANEASGSNADSVQASGDQASGGQTGSRQAPDAGTAANGGLGGADSSGTVQDGAVQGADASPNASAPARRRPGGATGNGAAMGNEAAMRGEAGAEAAAAGNGADGQGAAANGTLGSGTDANGAPSAGTAGSGATASGAPNAGATGAAPEAGTAPQAGSAARSGAGRGQGMNMLNQANSDFTMQEITVGITTDSQVEVLSGLSAGQTVLIPVVVSSGTNQNQMQMGGMGGIGGMGGAGVSFGGGGGFVRSGGGGGGFAGGAGGGRG